MASPDDVLENAWAAIKKLHAMGRASASPEVAMACQKRVTELATVVVEINNEKLKANASAYEEPLKRINAAAIKLKALKAGIDKTTKGLSAATQLLTSLNGLIKALA